MSFLTAIFEKAAEKGRWVAKSDPVKGSEVQTPGLANIDLICETSKSLFHSRTPLPHL